MDSVLLFLFLFYFFGFAHVPCHRVEFGYFASFQFKAKCHNCIESRFINQAFCLILKAFSMLFLTFSSFSFSFSSSSETQNKWIENCSHVIFLLCIHIGWPTRPRHTAYFRIIWLWARKLLRTYSRNCINKRTKNQNKQHINHGLNYEQQLVAVLISLV